jgi:micrococcal nuclease
VPNKRTLRWLTILVLAVVIAATGRGLLGGDGGHRLEGSVTGRVVRVVDGDTVRVRIDGRRGAETVRYIGIDTPESVRPGTPVQCFAEAASTFNRRLVGGRRVKLVLGRERRDRYGRLLAYVFVTGGLRTFVNAELVRRGYARTLTISPNTQYARRFSALQTDARARRLGLWRACPSGFPGS